MIDTVSSEYSEYESVMKRFETREDLRHSDILDSTHEINEYVSRGASFHGLQAMLCLSHANSMSTEFLLWLKSYVDRLCQSRVPKF